MFLFLFTAVLMIAAFIFMPKPSMQNATAAGLDEFDINTNSNGRAVPECFGTVEVSGNIIWYGDLSSTPIWSS